MAPSPSSKVNLVYFWLGRHGPDKSLSRTGARVRGWWPNEIHRSESPEPIPATDRVQVVVGTESVEMPAAQELRSLDSKPWRSGSIFSPFQFFQHGGERHFHLRKADGGRGRATGTSTVNGKADAAIGGLRLDQDVGGTPLVGGKRSRLGDRFDLHGLRV